MERLTKTCEDGSTQSNDFIRREDALRAVQEYRRGQDNDRFVLCGVVADLTELIEDIPAVDAVPVVRCGRCRRGKKVQTGHGVMILCGKARSLRPPDFHCGNGI